MDQTQLFYDLLTINIISSSVVWIRAHPPRAVVCLFLAWGEKQQQQQLNKAFSRKGQ